MAQSLPACLLPLLLVLLPVLVSMVTGQSVDPNSCLPETAAFNATSGVCECNAGFEGIGDLCCSPIADANAPSTGDRELCYLVGDPFLRSVEGQVVPINLPCSICVAVLEGRTADNRECLWEVLASSTIAQRGAIFYTIGKVAVSINRAEPKYITFTDGLVTLTERDGSIQPVTTDADGNAQRSIDGEAVKLRVDPSTGLMSVQGCGNTMVFRPNNPAPKGQPGLCMQAPKGSITKTVAQGNLCSLPTSYPTDVPRAYGILNDALITRLMFNNEQRTSDPAFDAECRVIDNMMEALCNGISQGASVKCGPILYNVGIRTCLDASGEKGKNILELFSLCMSTFCGGDKESCDALKTVPAIRTCLPSLQTCDTWPHYFGDDSYDV